ncbi:TatD family hydrolase [Neobacillus cucumis]|uniref:TatD family deoxyribonuclease n=1 Tax=Neobacillus cucumis TaxID=1740721 RepID=A0A2N5H8I5_9BACI|nr:TatD family hydrolase [Neobacillus cucumis]PLS01832.1 TatD family deoxyribonuclease [Neobacillus cucumis]
MKMIDAHIHLDQYKNNEIELIVKGSVSIEAVLSVSNNLESCKRNLELSKKYLHVKPAFGFHPEQSLPTENEFYMLLEWMVEHRDEMSAVGEVGLPYYLRKEQKVSNLQFGQYMELLEEFIVSANKWEKPIVLHAVYEDAPVVCNLLEKHSVSKAHFHWFKGDEKTIKRMIQNGYHISVTPEIVYKEKIQKLVQTYPLEQMMIETDGPWPFEGPFSGKLTTPDMMKHSISMIAKIKNLSETEVSERVFENTKNFYLI